MDLDLMEDVPERPEPERIVHLDLKGAPPRLSYYEKLFPLLRNSGATGVLVEYEDMFPYWGELEVIASPHAYSNVEVQRMQELATKSDLKFIPLVQTFGHFEFVLKHDNFRHLREVEQYPMALCPLQPDAIVTVWKMLEQVLMLHPQSTFVHIGGDEVFHLGLCPSCRAHLKTCNQKATWLFFQHFKQVLGYLQKLQPHVRAIMWDDMFREIELEELRDADIGELVEPMVWHYGAQISLPEGMWERYSRVFPCVWVASAFKGATGVCQISTNATHHIENQRQWLKIMQSKAGLFSCFRGYVITGWQRYDHYAVLCELLPVSIPCLVLCLELLREGHFTELVHKRSSDILKFQEPMPLNHFKCLQQGTIPVCQFPGHDIYTGVYRVLFLYERLKLLQKNERLRGWMSEYHLQRRFCNPAHIKHFLPEATELLEHMQTVSVDLRQSMDEIFYPDTADEWLCVNLQPKIKEVQEILDNAQAQIAIGARQKQVNHVNHDGMGDH